MSASETRPAEVPAWLADMEFCHVCPWDSEATYCGAATFGRCAAVVYEGEAICPNCGAPTCPRCAQLSALDDALEDA